MAEQNRSIPWAIIGGLGILTLVFILGSWVAGHNTGALEIQRLSRQVSSLQDQLASARADKASIPVAQISPAAQDVSATRTELQRCLAEANQYRSKLESDFAATTDGKELAAALLSPGAHVYQLHGQNAAAPVTAYVIAVPPSQLAVFARLDSPKSGRQFQLWAISPNGDATSAGMLPTREGAIYVPLDGEPSALESTSFSITEEPTGGSNQPTGPKVFTTED